MSSLARLALHPIFQALNDPFWFGLLGFLTITEIIFSGAILGSMPPLYPQNCGFI